MDEIWKKIDGFNNYSVSNFGRVRNDKFNKIKKNSFRKDGYLQIGLSSDDKIEKKFLIHRLVGLHFLDNPENKSEIDHIDRDKTNNNINNLRFATRAEQNRNREKKENTSSKYKGVYYNTQIDKWCCQVAIDNKQIYLGSFVKESEAGNKYNSFIKEHKLEEFFVLNEILL